MKYPELLILGIDGASPAYIKKSVARGELPNFAKLMKKGGFFDDCMTAFPSITPTCWTAIASGSVPSVNGALCHQVHPDGTNPTAYVTPYHSSYIRAERFWEAAARIGKRSLLLDVPCSGPAKCDGILQIKGGVTTTADACPSESYLSGVPQQFFTNEAAGPQTVDTVKTRAGGSWDAIKSESAYDDLGNKKYRFYPIYSEKKHRPEETEAHSWIIIAETEGVRIGIDEADAAQAPLLRMGEWSEVITRRLMTSDGVRVPFHFRARLDRYDSTTKTFTVFVSGAQNLYKEITPLSLAKELAEIPEICATDYSSLKRDLYNTDKFFDGERQSIAWDEQVLSHCIEKYEPEIVFDYYGNINTLNHRYRSAYEKLRIDYEGEYEIACDAMKKGYELVDEHLGWLMEHLIDEKTTVVLVSDHGSVGSSGRAERFHPWRILEEAGLMVLEENDLPRDWKNPYIDWSKTRAYPVGSCYINVNLKGREPCGIVKESDYEETVAEIIRALHTHGFSQDGKTPVLAFAVEKEQAGFIGHGGANCGDVVYGIVGSRIGGFIGGVHSQQIPSARSKTGDIRALCLMSGPNFKEGETLTRPTDLTDLAPTFCYALGYPQPKDATGGVVFQALKNE